MEHVIDDDNLDASKPFKALLFAIYAFFDLINSKSEK